MTDDSNPTGWDSSTEGDLDPDLTEEAGYADYEPVDRTWLTVGLRVIAIVILIIFLIVSASGLIFFFAFGA